MHYFGGQTAPRNIQPGWAPEHRFGIIPVITFYTASKNSSETGIFASFVTSMKKIFNPYALQPGYNCFGCSPHNPTGLKMEFYETDESIISEWVIGADYCGYKDVLHGGIQATLMDEIASWYVFVKCKTGGVTSGMEVKYHKPVQGVGKRVKLEARLREMHHKLAKMYVNLMDENGAVCSTAEVTYYLFPQKISRDKLGFPDPELFYKDEQSD